MVIHCNLLAALLVYHTTRGVRVKEDVGVDRRLGIHVPGSSRNHLQRFRLSSWHTSFFWFLLLNFEEHEKHIRQNSYGETEFRLLPDLDFATARRSS